MGAHIGNRFRGNIALSTLGTLVVTPVAVIVAVPLGEIGGAFLVPIAQIGVSVALERRTARGRKE